MAVAIIDHAKLKLFAVGLGFPLATKVNLVPEGYGYQTFDKFVRDNVMWVNELAFDTAAHIKITESAQLTGELPEPWLLRCQKFLEGTEETNTFNQLDVDGVKVDQLVNSVAIQDAIASTMLKYRVEFDETDGILNTISSMKVAIFDSAEDTSISYSSEVPVERIYRTKVDEVGGEYILFKQAYYEFIDPTVDNPWLLVGNLSSEEYEVWKEHNIKPEVDIKNVAAVDFRQIGEETTGVPVAALKDIFKL